MKGGDSMLVITFKIAVEKSRADEMRNTLMDSYGIAITEESVSTEKFCWSEPEERVYFKCFAPVSRFDVLAEYLDEKYTGTAILTSH